MVNMAPARIHRKDLVLVKALVIFLCIIVLVMTAVLTYSLCVMAKDEDDEEQIKWLRRQRRRDKKNKTGKRR